MTVSFRRFCLIIFLLITNYLLLITVLYADTNFSYGKTQEEAITIEPAEKGLRVGEKLVYDVAWNGINIGQGSLEVKEIVKINGRDAYHIVAIAKSNEFLSSFYRVEDEIHSYMDTKELCSLKFAKHQREGKYVSDEVVDFDQARHKGHYESLKNKVKKDFDIPPAVQDLTSVFYYFRTLDVKPDSKVVADVNADEKNWKVELNVLQSQRLELARRGVFKVFCVEPRAPFRGVISRRGKVWVYFTADSKRVPILIKIRVPFGFVTGVLENTE